MLQEIRMGNISLNTWNLLYQKAATPNEQPLNAILNTTNIVGYKKTANKINNMICNMLPVNENKFLINTAIDYINNEQHNPNESLELDDQSDELKRNDVSEMQIMRLDVIHMRILRITLTLYCYSNLEIGTPPIYP